MRKTVGGKQTSLREQSRATIGIIFFLTTTVATTPYTIIIEAIMAKSKQTVLKSTTNVGFVTRVVIPKSPMDDKHHRN